MHQTNLSDISMIHAVKGLDSNKFYNKHMFHIAKFHSSAVVNNIYIKYLGILTDDVMNTQTVLFSLIMKMAL